MTPQPSRPSHRWRSTAPALRWTLAATCLLLGGAAAAEIPDRTLGGADAVCEELPPAQAASSSGPASAVDAAVVILPGLRAFFDPDTGRPLTPPPAERRTLTLDPTLERALTTSAVGLPEERLPDGTHVLRLQGRFLSPLFGTLLDSGGEHRLVTGHGWAPAETSSPAPESTGTGGGEGGDDETP